MSSRKSSQDIHKEIQHIRIEMPSSELSTLKYSILTSSFFHRLVALGFQGNGVQVTQALSETIPFERMAPKVSSKSIHFLNLSLNFEKRSLCLPNEILLRQLFQNN